MPLRRSFLELRKALGELAGAVSQIGVHLDDVPRRPAFADLFQYGADDIEGWVAEAIEAADEAVGAIDGGPDLDQARIELVVAHERVLLVANKLGSLLTLERIEQLARFDEERGGRWARGLCEALERCREQLDGPQLGQSTEHPDGLHSALLASWQEVAERTAAGTVSVRATNIGQQVSAPAEGREATRLMRDASSSSRPSGSAEGR